MTPKINWQPSNTDIRKFGKTVLIGFLIIGALFFWRGRRPVAEIMVGVSAVVAVLSYAVPALAKPFYFVWMGFGFVMGSIMSRVILAIIFYAIISPVALVFRLIGRDELKRKKTSSATTYWEDHPKITDPEYYEHLF